MTMYDPDDSEFLQPQSEDTIAESNTICAGISDPYDKAKAIFNRVLETTTVIGFDLFDPKDSTYYKLNLPLQAQGIPSAFIVASRSSEDVTHIFPWNAAYLNGRWVYMDLYDRQFDPPLWLFSQERFVDDHANTRTVTPNRSTVLVNGKEVAFEAYTVNGNNYFKLRDVAQAFTGTEKQFEVTWDMEKSAINLISGQSYTTVGGELVPGDGTDKTAQTIYLDGGQFFIGAYAINGNNYVKLRDLGRALDFNVSWDNANQTIVIDTNSSYTPD